MFNWRDMRNPAAGGAEVYVHRVLESLASRGHRATLFTSHFPGAATRERLNGVEIVRYGGRFSIYPMALQCYRRHIEGRYDVIVESVNGAPFFTPLFAREPVVALVHQLTRENWFSGLPFPLAFAGFHAEDAMLSLYAHLPAVAVSRSTWEDLGALSFTDVRVIHGAGDVRPSAGAVKGGKTLLCLGRLAKSKRVADAIRALALVRRRVPDCRLVVAGDGPERGPLESLAGKLGVGGAVEFAGRVSETEKARLLSTADLMLFPAVREGWGLVVLEANACGTPVIGYDVPGLRDSIQEGINGLRVPDGDYPKMAEAAAGLLLSRQRLADLGASAQSFSSRFSWEKAGTEFLGLLEGVANG